MRWMMAICVSLSLTTGCDTTSLPDSLPAASAQPPRAPRVAVSRPPTPLQRASFGVDVTARSSLSLPQGQVEYHFPSSQGQEPVWRLVRPDGHVVWRQKGAPYQGTLRVSMAADQGRLFLLQWHPRLDVPILLGAYDLRDGTMLWTISDTPYGVLNQARSPQEVSLGLGARAGRVMMRVWGEHHDEELEVDAATGRHMGRRVIEPGPRSGAPGGKAVVIF